MTRAKDKYRAHCDSEKSIPLFSQAWWLDATAGEDNWDVTVIQKGTEVFASMPYVLKKQFGLTVLTQPPLTQTLGPWLRESAGKYATRLSQQKDLMEALIKELPHFHHYRQNWAYQQTNWLPFYWSDFKQTTRYTYVIEELQDEQAIWNGTQQNIRTDIKKAAERFHVRVREDVGVDEFLRLNRLVFDRQGMGVPYSESLVRKLDRACISRNARRIFIAEDDHGRRHAGVYLVWDENSAYYLMGGSDPELRNSGATSLCMWAAIKFAATVTTRFDFEGSMLEPVERYFRAFGAIQTPYFAVSKTSSKLLKSFFFLRDLGGEKVKLNSVPAWPTAEVLAWLQQILLERFGHAFLLQTVGGRSIRLSRSDDASHIDFAVDPSSFSRSDSELPCTTWDGIAAGWNPAQNSPLPAPGAAKLPEPLISRTEAGYYIHYDILGLTYWMLSRLEEIGRTDLDEHGRFPATSSHAFKHHYLHRPIVDEWLHLLGIVIQRTWPSLQLKRHQFSIKVSHDVDNPSLYAFRPVGQVARAMASDVLKRGNLKTVFLAPWVRLNSNVSLHRADPANTFDWIMDLSDRRGLTSAFYFICGCTDPNRDAGYDIEHPAIRRLIRRIHTRGHEIGLHPSYGSYQSPSILLVEAARLRRVASEEGVDQPVWGGGVCITCAGSTPLRFILGRKLA